MIFASDANNCKFILFFIVLLSLSSCCHTNGIVDSFKNDILELIRSKSELNELVNIFNSNLTSTCDADDDAVIVFRTSATYATLNLTGTTLVGTREILGATTQTTIKR